MSIQEANPPLSWCLTPISSDRNQNHLQPTAHRANWREDQGLVDDLTTEIEDCRRAHLANATTAAALLAALGQGPGPGAPAAAGNAAPTAVNLHGLPTASNVAHPGPALQSINNTAPVTPVPGPAIGFTTAGAQGQNNPSGTGQDQTDPPEAEQDQAAQPNDGDDAVGEQEEEQEQGSQPGVNNEDVTVEEQEEDQEQDERSTGTNNPAALVLGPTISTASTTAGTRSQTNPPGAEQGQADQPVVINEDNHDSEQDAEYEEEFALNFSPLRGDKHDRFLNARYEHGTSSFLTRVFFLPLHADLSTEQSLIHQPVNPHFPEGSSAYQDAWKVEEKLLSRADFGKKYE